MDKDVKASGRRWSVLLRRFGSQLRDQWLGAVALILVLGTGTAYAVTRLEADSVKSRHLVDGQVREVDMAAPNRWNEVGDANGPSFATQPGNPGSCSWRNMADSHPDFNTTAFYRARGVVYLKGLVTSSASQGANCAGFDTQAPMFTLPEGYRPARNELQPVVSSSGVTAVVVGPDGTVRSDSQLSFGSGYVSLDGVSFRCAPPGQNGCP